MRYLEYVVAAYGVFSAFLVWDFAVPMIRVHKAIRATRWRMKRESAREQSSGRS